jgi:WD40 repeat protein
LFHPSRAECLCTFKHASQVHSIAFHPKDDRFFLAGCKDGKLRLWSIPDKRVEYSANVNDMITAVTFSPDGKTSMAGTMNGNISIFTTEELKYSCHFLARGKKKCRVTSIQARHVPVGSDSIKLLVTTADSRIQLYNLRDKGLELKIKGHKNEEVAMSASINDDGRYIISGSEDKSVYIWSLTDTNDLPNLDKNKDKTIQRPMEFFEANTTKTTCAVMAPREARMILNGSGDPIYDICNPPPVKLVEREGSIASSTRWNGSNASINGGNLPKPNYTKSMPVEQSPALSQSAHFEDYLPTMTSSATFSIEDPTKSAAYNMRASHTTGHIIVTASTSGIIRVYRQDCAATKRAKALDLDPYARRAALRRAFTGATPSSRSSMSAPNGTRPVSVRSFKGARTPSIRSFVQPNRENRLSTTTGHGELVTRAKRAESSASSNHQPTRDRIERWRDDIDGVADSASSLRRTNSMHSATSASMVTANESPVKSRTPLRSSVASVTSGAALRTRADSGDTTNSAGVKSSVSGMPTSSSVDSPSRPGMVGTDGGDERGRRSSSFANPLHLQNGQSFMFWNVSQYEKPTSSTEAERPSASTRVSRQSGVSKLTSEESFDELDEDDEDDEEEDEAIRILKQKCPRCSGLEFTIKESRAWGFGKVKSVVCQQCGLERKNSGST